MRELGILVQEKAASGRQETQTVSYIDAFKLGQVLEDLGEDRVGDELHAAQGQDHEVGRHAADVADHVVLDPVVVLKVEAQGLLAQELAKVLFVQDSARHTFQILNLLPVGVFVELDIVELFDLPVAEWVFLFIRVFAEVDRLGVQRAFVLSLGIHFGKHRSLLFVTCCCQCATRVLVCNYVCCLPVLRPSHCFCNSQ